MSAYEFEEPVDVDADARYERDMQAEHVEAREARRLERLAEHVTPDPKPAKRLKRADAPRPDVAWREQILERDGGCVLHTHCDEDLRLHAHHCVPQSVMRRNGLGALLWDPRCGFSLCAKAHRQHHNRVRVIRLDEIPTVVREFVEAFGFGYWLERHYAPAPKQETEEAA